MLTQEQIVEIAIKLSQENTNNATYAAIVDFMRPANLHRFFLVNVKTKQIEIQCHTTHGRYSGPINGKNLRFSNVVGSGISSDGLMKTVETYFSFKFRSRALRMVGLEPGLNSNVYERAIVVHVGRYTTEKYVRKNKYPGRSLGCIVLPPDIIQTAIDKLKGGSVIFAATEKSLLRNGIRL